MEDVAALIPHQPLTSFSRYSNSLQDAAPYSSASNIISRISIGPQSFGLKTIQPQVLLCCIKSTNIESFLNFLKVQITCVSLFQNNQRSKDLNACCVILNVSSAPLVLAWLQQTHRILSLNEKFGSKSLVDQSYSVRQLVCHQRNSG